MSNEYQFTPSELVHLFVDGEADAYQQSALFSYLASDMELQEELRGAMLMRKTLEQVRATTIPPDECATAIFAKAGFAATETQAVVPVLSQTIIKSLVHTLLAATAGAGIAFVILSSALHQPAARPAGTASKQVAQVLSTPHNPDSAQTFGDLPSAQLTSQPTASGREIHSNSAAHVAKLTNGIADNGRISSGSRKPRRLAFAPDESKIAIENQSPLQAGTEPPASLYSDAHSITTAPIAEQQFALSLGESEPETLAFPPATAEENTAAFAVYLKSSQALKWYPSRDVPQQTITENISIGGLYYFSAAHAAGIEAGREFLPLYSFASTTHDYTRALWWIGGVYRYEPEDMRIAFVQPFAQTSLGITTIGPMGKALLGARIQAGDFLSATLGVEAASLVYRRNSSLRTTEKLGFTFSTEIRF